MRRAQIVVCHAGAVLGRDHPCRVVEVAAEAAVGMLEVLKADLGIGFVGPATAFEHALGRLLDQEVFLGGPVHILMVEVIDAIQ